MMMVVVGSGCIGACSGKGGGGIELVSSNTLTGLRVAKSQFTCLKK